MSLALEVIAAAVVLFLAICCFAHVLQAPFSLITSHSTRPIQPISASSSPSKMYPQFVLLGDSITEGSSLTLAARLSQWYARRLDVINRGFGGYTSSMGLEVLQQFFPAQTSPSPAVPRVQLMTVFFGANDACVPGHPQHVHLETYLANLKKILGYQAVKLHNTQVILVTPPPVDEWQLDGPDRTAKHTAKYAAAARELGAELQVPLLDLWTIFMHKAGWKEGWTGALPGSKDAPRNTVLGDLLSDGLHFTELGYNLMFDELVTLISQRLPDHVPEKLPMIFPDWKDKLGISN
jgi:isoamyl acetate esterase